ncbi:MAG: hypothetical protein LBF59_10315, partial [Prevotellaceae bacterium]|nr:hypothetical protein [Prevotellaceae bacterium]
MFESKRYLFVRDRENCTANNVTKGIKGIFLFVVFLLFSFTGEEDRHTTVFEKVYLHLDRHYYISGDDIWFKAYLIDAQTNKLSPKSSRTLYAELISPESKILQRRVLFVDTEGCAIGDFRIKKTAVSGK